MNKKQCVAQIKNVKIEDGSDISIVIAAAKRGKNLRGLGNRSLFTNKKDKTLIEKQISTINNIYPKAEIIIVINEDAFLIRKIVKEAFTLNIRFVINPNIDCSNILYSIGLGIFNITNDRVIIIPGDLCFDEGCIQDICNKNSKTLLDTNCYLPKNKIGIITYDSIIECFSYQSTLKWGKITYLEYNDLRLFKVITEHIINDKKYNLLFHEGLMDIIDKRGKLVIFSPPTYFLFEIDNVADMERFRRLK